MKARGKIPGKQNDFDIMRGYLLHGMSRLENLKDSPKLSDEQRNAIIEVMSKTDVLQQAMNACSYTERTATPETRAQRIGEDIAQFQISSMSDFSTNLKFFISPEAAEESRAQQIDRAAMADNLRESICGARDLADMDYTGLSMYD